MRKKTIHQYSEHDFDAFDEKQPPKHPRHHYEGEAWNHGGSPKKKRVRKSTYHNEVEQEYNRLQGSATHGTMLKEPSLKKLRVKANEIYEGEPHRFSGPPKKQRRMETPAAKHRHHIDENDLVEHHHTGKWIKATVKNPGALHKSLGIPKGQRIPDAAIEKAEHSKNATLRRRATLAETLRGFHHKD